MSDGARGCATLPVSQTLRIQVECGLYSTVRWAQLPRPVRDRGGSESDIADMADHQVGYPVVRSHCHQEMGFSFWGVGSVTWRVTVFACFPVVGIGVELSRSMLK
jgi:hypothetical protein